MTQVPGLKINPDRLRRGWSLTKVKKIGVRQLDAASERIAAQMWQTSTAAILTQHA